MSITLSSLPGPLAYAVAAAEDSERRGLRRRMTAPTPMPPPDDRAATDSRLMAQVARGDRQAFSELYDRFSAPLYATALRIVRDSADAQDIVHDAFVGIWEKAATFEDARGTAFSWAVTLVRNRAIDRVRMRRRRSEILADSVPADLGYHESGVGADDSAAQGDQAKAVRAAVSSLPPDQQRALELAFFSGLTQEEIAQKLSAPLGTVKARIRRGLLKLRDALAHRL